MCMTFGGFKGIPSRDQRAVAVEDGSVKGGATRRRVEKRRSVSIDHTSIAARRTRDARYRTGGRRYTSSDEFSRLPNGETQ